MGHRTGLALFLIMVLLLAGCATGPSSRLHYTIKQDPGSRPLQQVVLLPVEADVFEMSTGGVKEEVPGWSSAAKTNIRNALLASNTAGGKCCSFRKFDDTSLTPAESEVLEEHMALFKAVVTNALWADLPANTSWHFKADHFDYTLGDGLGFLKTSYGVDAGLVILGEDVVSSAGRKTAAVMGALFGVAVPLGHTILMGGLVDFRSGDLLWMNYKVSAGNTDLRDPDSCRELTHELMEDYPGLRPASDSKPPAGN